MSKIKTLADLSKVRDEQLAKEQAQNEKIRVNVSLATCSIAAGGKKTLEAIESEVAQKQVDNVVIRQSGCMTFCYAEPTVEVTLPGREPVIFGYVDEAKGRLIVEKYILKGELVDGVIPANYERVVC